MQDSLISAATCSLVPLLTQVKAWVEELADGDSNRPGFANLQCALLAGMHALAVHALRTVDPTRTHGKETLGLGPQALLAQVNGAVICWVHNEHMIGCRRVSAQGREPAVSDRRE